MIQMLIFKEAVGKRSSNQMLPVASTRLRSSKFSEQKLMHVQLYPSKPLSVRIHPLGCLEGILCTLSSIFYSFPLQIQNEFEMDLENAWPFQYLAIARYCASCVS